MEFSSYTCTLCGNNKENKTYMVKEMMFGTKEQFEYFECSECGCLQLKDLPPDMTKYYPENYGSFSLASFINDFNRQNFLVHYLKKKRASYALYHKSLIGWLTTLFKPVPEFLLWLQKCHASFDSKILDAGCGIGTLLLMMYYSGFKNLTGIDPFIKADIAYPNGMTIHKKTLFQVDDTFDIIILNHSFEHMKEPLNALKQIERLLNKDGYTLIRIPTVSSYAWQHYRTNWVQLDAPRHFYLHSLKSIEYLLSQTNLEIKEIYYDSTALQFWGSEQYLQDIPFRDGRSYLINPSKSIFTENDICTFTSQADKLNTEKQGDQVCIFLTRS